MSSNEQVNISIDRDLKNGALKVFQQLGITEDEAIRLFYEQVELNQGLPFRTHNPNKETLSALQEANDPESLTQYSSFNEWKKNLFANDDQE